MVTLGAEFHGRRSSEKLAILLDALLEPEDDARERAIDLYAQFVNHLEPLLGDLLLSDPDPDVRAAAASALGDMGGAVALATLGQALHSDADPAVRGEAAFNLAFVDDQEAAGPLARALAVEKDPEARRWIIASLEDYPGDVATAALEKCLAEDPDPQVRAAADDVLKYHARKKEPSNLSPEKKAEIDEAFEKILLEFMTRRRLLQGK